MTGPPTPTDSPESPGRRQFLEQAAGLGFTALLATSTGLNACHSINSHNHIQGGMAGANHQTGHLLRNPEKLPLPSRSLETEVLIVGGGIAGLSARRWLWQHGLRDVLLVEMDNQTGGNSVSGQNAISAYPWGAHYLPIPDLRNRELLDFLKECHAITGFDPAGLPIYNEYYLCHDPEERLFINGHWQAGLVPEVGVPEADKQQITRFFKLIEQLKHARGSDGKDAFAIPLGNSSTDENYRKWDAVSFETYLNEQQFTSTYLRWFLEYGCKDDYGSTLENTSAWAGLHYFASRKGVAANAEPNAVLTWPEGNNFLVRQLEQQAQSPVHSNRLVFSVQENERGVQVLCYDVLNKETVSIQARKVLLATPQFITQNLLKNRVSADFQYSPWLVANLTVSGLPQGRGLPLCWDNVIYGSPSVGYVTATHQHLNIAEPQKVITVYWPLVQGPPATARQKAYETAYETWVQQLLTELETAHPGVMPYIHAVDCWIWGHGMIVPAPGFIWGESRRKAAQPINGKLFFAHSDLSGISIFEEAFYQGIRAAKEILEQNDAA
ncbi:FAD-dependent oxidoreductase [Larkinella rosea]|uniref:NAD(P)/FAD-dependent oxidoreductase n=1 Tax=Larkinella rosea TaxID=2025312 RepID=A0A3P1C0L7_9BACT|nr:FAD/NAD(P)-binding protein [Larkinella rosea]RRB06749.1 NAD(P)/FAD-dependent oxidoreductase [Larkinella rosea]